MKKYACFAAVIAVLSLFVFKRPAKAQPNKSGLLSQNATSHPANGQFREGATKT